MLNEHIPLSRHRSAYEVDPERRQEVLLALRNPLFWAAALRHLLKVIGSGLRTKLRKAKHKLTWLHFDHAPKFDRLLAELQAWVFWR